MAKDKTRFELQIYWQGGWRTILKNDSRKPLAEYAQSCSGENQLRIIDTEEEEVKRHGRRH